MKEWKANVHLGAKRPGDVLYQLAALAKIRSRVNRVSYSSESLFLNFTQLDCFANLEFNQAEPPNTLPSIPAPARFALGRFKWRRCFGSPCDFKLLMDSIDRRFSYTSQTSSTQLEPLKIFVSLESEKRRWLGQIEFIQAVLEMIKRSPIAIVNNGMTQLVNGNHRNWKQDQLMHERMILKPLLEQTGAELIDLFGYSLEEKFPLIRDCSLAIVPLGTPMVISLASGLPTIAAGNHFFHRYCRKHSLFRHDRSLLTVPQKYTTERGIEKTFRDKRYSDPRQLQSYRISTSAIGSAIDFAKAHVY